MPARLVFIRARFCSFVLVLCVSLNVSLEVVAAAGIAFVNASGGRGLGAESLTERKGSVSGCICGNAAEIGCCIHTATHCALT